MSKILASRPLYEEVADQLRVRIFAHELAPGTWIDEQTLAKEFGISRTPLREAIKVLAAEGLITMKLRRGAYVTEVNRGDLEQIFTILSLLEGQAAKEAATKAQEKDLNELDDMHLRLEKAAADRNLEQFFEVNVRFHERVIAIANNPWLTDVIADLRKVLKLQRKDALSRSGRLQSSLSEHREILKALLKRDPIAAEQAMRTHLARGLEAAK
jgi:DNA-binding GntR family transcriptional regulator